MNIVYRSESGGTGIAIITEERCVITDMDSNADSDGDTYYDNSFCSMERYE